ncbi:receptor-type tyrosine-protein kinase FLT3-like isoform X3 [Pygocentrus nattereri]|uniref:receptor-type tyrosine-protein kinase FLT3-like isoform X3 n=1 Tax=Pygocentrus nattereri TaxID=42514 RepID=UPI001891E615|nr:receptor-type tyrosine-protein kinase FLT3-like isoform X3 [Pygocentrus nattereri]
MAVSTLDGFNYQTSNTNCCATNSQGKECALIYHYELGKPMRESEAPQILLNPGQSLALRCKANNKKTPVEWFFNNTKLSGLKTLWYASVFKYFSIESVSEHNSGEYVCKSEDGQSKATQVQVQEEDLIEILELNENVRIWEKEKATFCLHVQVLAYPKPQCDWITPIGTKVQSDETHDIWNNHTFKLCNPEPGQYQIQLRADKKLVTKNLSLCVTDTPKFTVLQNLHEVTCMTNSSLPQALSWKICPLPANLLRLLGLLGHGTDTDVLRAYLCPAGQPHPSTFHPEEKGPLQLLRKTLIRKLCGINQSVCLGCILPFAQ